MELKLHLSLRHNGVVYNKAEGTLSQITPLSYYARYMSSNTKSHASRSFVTNTRPNSKTVSTCGTSHRLFARGLLERIFKWLGLSSTHWRHLFPIRCTLGGLFLLPPSSLKQAFLINSLATALGHL